MSKRVLLTGIGGFIGHHTAEHILDNTDWHLTGLDSWLPQHKGDKTRISDKLLRYIHDGRLRTYNIDLSVPISPQMENILLKRKFGSVGDIVGEPFDYIINMASDSHVTRSIHEPARCWTNNCNLIANMLEFARRTKPRKFIQISTDEVYGDAGWDSPGHPEWDTIKPSNPYSASKAAQEALAIAYWRTYETPVIITNTMNVIGERQDPEKFLPKILGLIMHGKPVHIHCDGPDRIASRVWLDAKNMADALLFLLRDEKAPARYNGGRGAELPDRYNIVGETEKNVLELAQLTANILGKQLNYELVRGDTERPGYDRRYALDGTKLAERGWRPPFTFEQTFERVVTWTTNHPEWMIVPHVEEALAGAQ